MSEESTQGRLGEQIFNQFCDSNDFREILQLFSSLCSEVKLDSNQYDGFYSTLKSSFTSWKATSLFQLLDARAALPEYDGGRACAGKRVLVVGAGPVGLRGAIELALLGAKVDLVEKRPDFQRNNSLHLWPFLITDLRNLGAKKFYGRFASGSIDHICIRILQAILLKVCLLLGVKVHAGVTFKGIIEPTTTQGWRAEITPVTTPISSNDYDVILAADGKQNSVPGFRAKEFRAKLALAITVNFVNHNTQQENSVPEIGGVAFVYRQDFFNNLAKTHGIELENIVYYKDETHYFVMTVRKQSLLRKGVLKTDNNDPKQLLSSSNIDRKQLENFALEATCFSTEGGLGDVEFEKNHRGENDVALFDFTSLFAAENAARIIERKGRRLLLCLAGDSLIEPFWPTGSGCARGFLGVFDNAWMIKRFISESASPIELIEEREAILYLLPQTTPRRLSSNFNGYTIDPKTRYLNLSELVPPGDVSHLYDTDNQNAVATMKSRTSVPPSTQDKLKPATEQKTVEPTIKRSKSSEVLSSEARSATASPHHTSTPSQPQTPEPSSADVKHFWQKRLSVKDDTRSPQKKEPSKDTISDKESKPVTKDSRATPKDTKTTPKEPKTVLKDSKVTTKDTAKGSKTGSKDLKPSSKDAKAPTKDSKVTTKDSKAASNNTKAPTKVTSKDSKAVSKETKQSSKSSPPKGRESPIRDLSRLTPTKQASPQHKTLKVATKPPPSPRATGDSLHRAKTFSEGNKATKQAPSSPKWPRLFSKGRARSESPERSPKLDKKSEKDRKDHPLKVTRSLQDIDKEAKGASDTQVNVLDIVKKYDLRAESLTKSEVAAKVESGKQPSVKAAKESAEKSRKVDSPKVKKTDKAKGEKKSKDEKKSDKSKEDKKASKESKGGFFSLFKSRKSYDVSGASAKDKKLARVDDKPLNEPSEQPMVQRRIDQLKQVGLMTDGAEDTDVVLVGVSPLSEAAKEEERPEDVVSSGEQQPDNSVVQPEGEVPTSKGNSPVSDATSEGESTTERGNSPEAEATKDEVEDSIGVKQLAEVFSKRDHAITSRHLSISLKRSKEIDLSDVPSQKSKSGSSHPLWLARVIQGMSKCLERLRKEHEIMVVKTALEILNTILSNVQAHPDSDVYRRVRVSSEAFSKKVWQLTEASQFLARAGWVQIEEFIVLPMDANVDNAKRVLDKHLNIVNQMLWSRQLELPHSSPEGVVMRPPTDSRIRNRVASLTRRESYSTRLVDESLQRIEEDTVNMLSAGDPFPPPSAQDETDLPSTKTDGEEEQMLRSASAARTIWKQRSGSQDMGRTSFSTNGGKEKLISESVLYDLPALPKLSTGSLKTQLPSVSEDTDTASKEETDQPNSQAFDVFDERLKKLNQSRKISGPQSVGETPSTTNGKEASVATDSVTVTAMDKEASRSGSPENTSPCPTPEGTPQKASDDTKTPPRASSPPPISLSPSNSNHGDGTTTSLSPSNSSRGDQLRELLGTRPVSPSAQETAKNETDVKPATDAQHSTDHSIRTERVEYGNLTMKAAAETREKWKQTEEASIGTQKTQTNESMT